MSSESLDQVWQRVREAPRASLGTQEYADRAGVIDVMTRYAHCIDSRDFDGYRSLFADKIDLDFSAINGNPPGIADADGFVEGVKTAIARYPVTQHLMMNHLVALDETTAAREPARGAHCVCFLRATHLLGDIGSARNGMEVGGRYTLHVVRPLSTEPWLIDRFAISLLWRHTF